MTAIEPPYLGAAYYPEAWDRDQIDEDIAWMKEAGLNLVRIGEFAWSQMEPAPGRYDFDWLHLVVDKLAQAGIGTIMGTPTAAMPVWLTQAHPEILAVNEFGRSQQHGARRHACVNSPVFREYCTKIVTRLAQEFDQETNIIGWQIDNELYPARETTPLGCFCEVCYRKFHKHLKKQFGSIDVLNKAWGTNIWSQNYQAFEQIPLPRPDIWHHPSLLTAWMDFQADSCIEFAEFQAEILRQLVRKPIGTDMIMLPGLSYERINRKLDVVQFNHYHNMDNLWQAAFWMDMCRPLKERPFWNTETSTCWNSSNKGTSANGYKEPGFCRANSWLPIALGGEANLYWLWRAPWSGQECMHGSVLSSCGRPMHMFDEIKEIAADFRTAAEFINDTKAVKPSLALHFSAWAHWLYRFQSMVAGFNYSEYLLNHFYHPLMRAQFRMDVIDPAASLESYRMICSPFLPALDEAGLRSRLEKWIRSGGTWLVGPLADIRTVHCAKFTDSPFGSLEQWAAVHCRYSIPADQCAFDIIWKDGSKSRGSLWFDGLELRGAKALATYTTGPLKGLAAVTKHKMGRGQIVMLGTLPEPQDLMKLLMTLAKNVDIAPVAQASPNLLVVPRQGTAGKGAIVVELANRPGSIVMPQPAVNLLTGEKFAGKVDIAPYGVAALKF